VYCCFYGLTLCRGNIKDMISFNSVNLKEWEVLHDQLPIMNLHLVSSSVTNKFSIVTNFIERVSAFCGDDFDLWFIDLLKKCEQGKEEPIFGDIKKLKSFACNYIESRNMDFSIFVDESKAKKSSILFSADEIEKIIKLSSCLKIYSVISNSENLQFGHKFHREVYNIIASDIEGTEIVSKIFNVVKTKTFKYNLSDKYMWDYIKLIQCKSIDVHVVEIFNFIMNSILVLCEEDKNPITYFVGVIDESVKWFLRSVYKGSVVYDDSISTEDIHGISSNNLKTYSYNDTLGRLKAIAFEKIYESLESQNVMNLESSSLSDQYVVQFHNRLSGIEFISPLCDSLVFPVLSKVTEIPYNHFRTLSPEHCAVLSVYIQGLLTKAFKSDFKSLFSLLSYYPLSSPSIATTYKLKLIHEYLDVQNTRSFFNFKTKTVPHRLLCHYVGRVSRVNFCDLVTGKKLTGIPLSKVESDMINFYTLYFSNQLNDKFQTMTDKLNQDF